MIKKLLKYDFKAIFKYWWIAAVTSLALSVAGGWCITVFKTEKELPEIMNILSGIIMFLVIMGFSAFCIVTTILIFVRFYKNFFSDEGYLTFTLPVKRTQLLNSKLITSTVAEISTLAVLGLDVIFMLAIGFADEIFNATFWKEIKYGLAMIMDKLDFHTVMYGLIYLIECIVILLLFLLFSELFLYACITFASIIAKKAKVMTAIAIYYVASGIFSSVIMLFFIFGIGNIDSYFSKLPDTQYELVIALILLEIILLISAISAILYVLQYWMMDRKLNLN